MNRITAGTTFGAMALLAGLTLSGCKGSDATVEATNASVESVASQVAASSIKPRPGHWDSTVKIDKLEIAGIPPEAQAAMQQRLGSATRTAATCLTPEQAAKPDASFFQQAAKDCTYDHFSMTDGKIDAKMICRRGAMSQTMLLSGTYTADSYDLAINAQGEAQPGKPMTMAMSMTSKRTGECTGKEPKAAAS